MQLIDSSAHRRPSRMARAGAGLIAVLGCIAPIVSTTASAQTVDRPTVRTVLQRDASDRAAVPIVVTPKPASARARATVLPGYQGTAVGWQDLTFDSESGLWQGLALEAGGWYQLEIEVTAFVGGNPVSLFVDRVGVGEVFITAGQSNSANHGREAQTPSHDIVSAYDIDNDTWVFAADPQPVATTGPNGEEGSPWPLLGDHLVERLGVPVGFVSVGVGGSRVRGWLPTSETVFPAPCALAVECFSRLVNAVLEQEPTGVRGILWHQGETDSREGQTTTGYSEDLLEIVDELRLDTGREVPWFVSRVGYHPNGLPSGEHAIVSAQQLVSRQRRAVYPGVSTDDMKGGYRFVPDPQAPPDAEGIHFSVLGLEEHARRWAEVLAPSSPAGRQVLDVRNPSLEVPVAIDGGVVTGTSGLLNAWEERIGANFSTINPDDTQYADADDDGPFLGNLPGLDGVQLGRFWQGEDGVDVRQKLYGPDGIDGGGDDPHPEADTHYQVEVAIGSRPDVADGGFGVELLTTDAFGEQEDVLALAQGGQSPAGPYGFRDVTVGWTAATTEVGRELAVRIYKPTGGVTYASFDDVRVTGLPVTVLHVENPSFEAPPIPVDGGNTTNTFGWTSDGNASLKDPTATDYPGAGGGDSAPGMDGKQVAQLWRGSSDQGLRQVLQGQGGAADPTVEADTWYQLTVAVGHRAGIANGGYVIQLVALGATAADDHILASAIGAVPPGEPGEFRDVRVAVAVPADSPDLGRPIEIRLLKSFGDYVTANSTPIPVLAVMDFDNVRMISAP